MIQQLLLTGQVVVIVLVYLFVWRVMRTASRDVSRGGAGASVLKRSAAAPATATAPTAGESTIIPAAQAAAARRAAGLGEPRIVVVASDGSLRVGVPYVLEGPGLSVGRADDNDIVLDDAVVSGHHARFLPPGVVHDLGSTNGTLVNQSRVTGRSTLTPGDTVSIGGTTFRFEVTHP